MSLSEKSENISRRWDMEWINYFRTESTQTHFSLPDDFAPPDKMLIKNMSPREVFDLKFEKYKGAPGGLCIWVSGSDIVDKNIFEMGCGCGYLGKQIGLICKEYLGIDHSRLALCIARLTSPSNCNYYHTSEIDEVRKSFKGRFNTMIGRYFFIHQNYESLTEILNLAHILLKIGGRIWADFFLKTPKCTGKIYPARTRSEELSCAYEFTDEEIETVCKAHNFRSISIERIEELERKFVCLEKY